MNPSPQSFTSPIRRALLAVLATGAVVSSFCPVLLVAQDSPKAPESTADAKPAAVVSDKSAGEVFAAIEQKVNSADSLTCRLQQTITMSGQRFLAAGHFVHASGNRMKLEYHIYPVRAVRSDDGKDQNPVGETEDTSGMKATGQLTQVSDGSVLWSYWVNGKDKQLTRRNIQEIINAVDDLPNNSNVQNLQSLGVGGLQALMSQLQAGMEFGAVQEQTISDTRLLVLSGRWNQQTRTEVFKLPEDSAAPLPDYLPDYVRVYVDAAAMLPRRIQYLKKHPNPEVRQVRPLVTLDLRDINLNTEIPEGTFEFTRPEDKDLQEVDLTSQIIEGIKQVADGTSPAKDSAAETTE